MSVKKFVFVLMPFDPSFDDIYKFGIKETCDKLGAYAERVDEQIFKERILDRIYNQISKADLIIADMTGRNPNVYYEVGYTHGIGKHVVLITKDAKDIPFDLKHFPHIVYDSSITKLKSALTTQVEYFLSKPPGADVDYEFPLEFYIAGEKVVDNLVFKLDAIKQYVRGNPIIKFDVYNASAKLFQSNLDIGIETHADNGWFFADEGNTLMSSENIVKKEDKIIYMTSGMGNIYPKGYGSVTFPLPDYGYDKHFGEIIDFKLVVFTNLGVTEIPFKIETPSESEH